MSESSFDPGLTQKYAGKINRIVNADGSFNVRRSGSTLKQLHLYQWLTCIPWHLFFAIILAAYVVLNAIFAVLYLWIGVEHLNGVNFGSAWDNFLGAFFFSFQTFTTVGYGAVSPGGIAANVLAAIEALCGILCFALITGIFYGRFTRPAAKILYSKKALVTPFREGQSLQFRMVNQRANLLLDVEATAFLMTVDRTSKILKRNYYVLKLDVPRINFLTLTWTLVHPIDETSPLWNKVREELSDAESEIIIGLKAFDESYGATVYSRHSYRADEIVWNARFQPAFHVDEDGEIVIDIEKLDFHEPINS